MAQRGPTQAEIADCFGVNARTLQYWLLQYPELQDAIAVGNEAFDTRVERALAERAIGFFVDISVWTGKMDRDGKPIMIDERRYFPPDVTAGIYWTKNRMPEKWRDVQRHRIRASRHLTLTQYAAPYLRDIHELSTGV